MAAIGPVLGGWLIDTVSWRAIFLINVPMAIGSIVLAVLFVKDSRREKDAPSLDLLSGVLATAALGTHLTAEHATQPDRPFAAVALDALKQALLTVVGLFLQDDDCSREQPHH